MQVQPCNTLRSDLDIEQARPPHLPGPPPPPNFLVQMIDQRCIQSRSSVLGKTKARRYTKGISHMNWQGN